MYIYFMFDIHYPFLCLVMRWGERKRERERERERESGREHKSVEDSNIYWKTPHFPQGCNLHYTYKNSIKKFLYLFSLFRGYTG